MDQEAGREAWWLLNYFTLPVDQLWSRLPELSERWAVLASGSTTSQPLQALTMILVEHHLVDWGEYFDVGDSELEVLDDLRLLLSCYLVGFRPELFEPPDFPATEKDIVSTPYMIWRVVRRLCGVALSRPSVQRFAGASFDVGYFYERYTTPGKWPAS